MTNSRIVGIDSLASITPQLLTEARDKMGQVASFCGRYLNTKPTQDPGDYSPDEGRIIGPLGIRTLLIARQTNQVGGARSVGKVHGIAQGQDIIRKFGAQNLIDQGGRVKFFLDCEGSGESHLSTEYFMGWDEGLLEAGGDITIEPCVYGIPGDFRTWNALAEAIRRGARCFGAWLSHPYVLKYVASHEPVQWAPAMLRPYAIDVPILLWQYGFYGHFDANIVNPELADATEFLRTLPLGTP